jgi:CRISPR/Cas system-associated exonuclease Cas4 (RecB family)
METGKNAAQYRVLPPSVSLVDEAAGQLLPDGLDYSQNLVVFPGKRPAHFLRKVVAQAVGSSYIPPAVFSMEELIDNVYGKIDGCAAAKIETIDAIAFLFDLHRSMEKPLGGREFLSLEAFFPLGLRIYRDIEELLIEGVEPARLRDVEPLLQTPLPPRTGGGLQSLSFFYDGFYPAIGKAGFSSRSQRYAAVSSRISRALLPYARIVFAGFYALTESERRLFRELLSWENVCFLFTEGPGLAEKLASLGITHRPPSSASPTGDEGVPQRAADIHFYKSADVHGQAFALASVLKGGAGEKRTQGQDDLSTVIVLPAADTLFPVLHHALPLAGGSYNISLGYPLERTPAWGFLVSLMQLVSSMDEDRVYIPDYLGFALHPYTKNIYMEGRTEVTRIMFHTLEELLLADRTKSFISLEEIEGRTDIFTAAAGRLAGAGEPVGPEDLGRHLSAIHDALVRLACAFDNIADFAARMARILSFIYDRSSARLHPFFHPFVESLLNELDNLRKSRIRDLAFGERNSYFHFLKRYIAHCMTPFEGTPLQGVQVLGFLETRALRFERVCVLDVNEDVLPDTRKEETLLPFKVRQILKLPTYADRDMLSAYYFDTLVKGAGEAHIFFVENDRKEKSRFAEKLLWERQKKDGSAGVRYVRTCGGRMSLENALPRPVEKTASMAAFLKARSYDATSLDAYLKCPLQFYYRYVLDLKPKEGVSPGIERVDVGRLVHAVLFRYFEKKTGRVLTRKDLDAGEMRGVAARVFEESYGAGPIGPAYLLRRQVIRRMEAFLVHHQAVVAARAPVTVLSLERRLSADFRGFRLKGIIDRIETRGGRTCIVDYKITASPRRLAIDFDRLDPDDRAGFADAAGSLQLPFYLLLYERQGALADGGGAAGEVPDALFLLLGRTLMDEKMEAPLFADGDRTADYGKVREVIFRLMGEIADAKAPFSPEHRAKDACLFCDYRYLCGTQWQAS